MGVLWIVAMSPVAVLIWPGRPYAIDLLAHFAPWWLAMWLAVGAVGWAARQWRIGLAFGCGAGSMLLLLIAFQWPAPNRPAAADAMAIRLVVWNAGGWNVEERTAFAEWVGRIQPDLLILPEPTRSMYSGRESSLRLTCSHHLRHPGSAATFSRWPIEHLEGWRKRIKTDRPLVRLGPTVVMRDGSPTFLIVGAYFESPRSRKRWRTSLKTVDHGFAALGEYTEPAHLPMILAGDFNSTPQGRVYQRVVERSGMIDAARGLQLVGTWPANLPGVLRLPIDHVFVSRDIHVVSYEIGPDLGSDHRPVLVELLVPRIAADAVADPPAAD